MYFVKSTCINIVYIHIDKTQNLFNIVILIVPNGYWNVTVFILDSTDFRCIYKLLGRDYDANNVGMNECLSLCTCVCVCVCVCSAYV